MGKESPYEVVIQPWNKNLATFEDILSSVLEIEEDSYQQPLDADDFFQLFDEKNVVGVVAVDRSVVVGYAILKLRKTGIEIVKITVAKRNRRQKVGTDLLGYVVTKALTTSIKNVSIYVELRESNLHAQLFFKSFGFLYTHTLPSHYKDTGEDAYVLVLAVRHPVKQRRKKRL